MASNSFGSVFRITTFGESHGAAMGVVIDGCPAGLSLCVEDIQGELERRAPGRSPYTSPRQEGDQPEILSGVFEGQTTGASLCILVRNRDGDPSKYESLKGVLRPGHANFTYLEKYGIFDYRGGGRASGRETVCRVAAGAVAQKLLAHFGITVQAYLKQVADVMAVVAPQAGRGEPPLFCPDAAACALMEERIIQAKEEGDSLGGVVEFVALHMPAGLGDPIYEKLHANLAKAMFTIPAVRGFEMGSGFEACSMKGSLHNDRFALSGETVITETNHAGGVLGGISTGMPCVGRVVFKPTSSIQKSQETITRSHDKVSMTLPEGSRHDPCVAIRGVPVVEAMARLVIADAWLLNRCAKL